MPSLDLTGGDSAIYVIETLTSWGGAPMANTPVNRETVIEDLAFYKECNIPVVAIHSFIYDGKVTF